MTKPKPTSQDLSREVRRLRSLIRDECELIYLAEVGIDTAMQGPSTEERGVRIAKCINQITMCRQSLVHFGLGIPLSRVD
jgi:hypothetical protein